MWKMVKNGVKMVSFGVKMVKIGLQGGKMSKLEVWRRILADRVGDWARVAELGGRIRVAMEQAFAELGWLLVG